MSSPNAPTSQFVGSYVHFHKFWYSKLVIRLYIYAWFKHPSIGSRVSLLPHHYVNINLQTKKSQGIVSVIIYSMYMQPICQKYYVFEIYDPCLLDQGVVYYPKICKKTAYFKIFDGNVVCCFCSIVQHCNQASF